MNEIIISTAVAAITGIGGFIWGMTKDKADLVSKSLMNLQQQITVYEGIINSLRSEITQLVEKVESQQKVIKHLEEKMEECFSPKSNI